MATLFDVLVAKGKFFGMLLKFNLTCDFSSDNSVALSEFSIGSEGDVVERV